MWSLRDYEECQDYPRELTGGQGTCCSSVSVTGDECFQGKGQWVRGDWRIPGNSAPLLNRKLLEY